jgi:hypothetical protein
MIRYPLHYVHNPEKEYNDYSKKSPGNIAKKSMQTFIQTFPDAGWCKVALWSLVVLCVPMTSSFTKSVDH